MEIGELGGGRERVRGKRELICVTALSAVSEENTDEPEVRYSSPATS